MNIGIIVAMEKERVLLETLKDKNGKIGGKEVVITKSGVGKVNAAVAVCRMIDDFSPDIVISTGVAGGVDSNVADVLDVVIGEATAYHDVDCGPDMTLGQVQGLPRKFAADTNLLKTAIGCKPEGVRTIRGLLATGDKFVTAADDLKRITKLYPDVAAIDMESAAIAHVCHLRAIPCIAMRVVSDIPGVENHFMKYLDFWDRVGEKSFSFLSEFLRKLP